MTVLNLITSALNVINVAAPSQPLNSDDANTALAVFNGILNSANAQPLKPYQFRRFVFPFVTSKQIYTIGPATESPDFSTVLNRRPVKIQSANIILNNNPTTPSRKSLNVLNVDQYMAIPVLAVTTNIPQDLYYRPSYPLGEINLWPYPSTGNSLELYLPGTFQDALLTDDFIYPDGYYEWMKYELAWKCQAEFSKPFDPFLRELRMEATQTIEANNAPSPLMTSDFRVPRRGGWNYLTGEGG